MNVRTIKEIREGLAELERDDTVERLIARARAHYQEAMRLAGLPPLAFDDPVDSKPATGSR
jgi:hypothetical protein